MLFGKDKKPVELGVLKVAEPEAYAAIMAEAKSEVETESKTALVAANVVIAEYKAKEAKAENESNILAYGEKLGVSDLAAQCVKDGDKFSDALVKMVDADKEAKEDLKESFEATAPEAVGTDLEEDESSKPKSFHEAINMIASRDSITKMEASKKAKVEFKDLLDAAYSENN